MTVPDTETARIVLDGRRRALRDRQRRERDALARHLEEQERDRRRLALHVDEPRWLRQAEDDARRLAFVLASLLAVAASALWALS